MTEQRVQSGRLQQNFDGFAGPPDPVLPHAHPTRFGFATVVLTAFLHNTRSTALPFVTRFQLLAMHFAPLDGV